MSQIGSTPGVTIPSGAGGLSPAVFIGGTLTGIQMPVTWVAAAITFQHSLDNVTYNDLFLSGTEVSITVLAGQFVQLNPTDFCDIRYLKVRSGTSVSPVDQTANRVIQLSARHFE